MLITTGISFKQPTRRVIIQIFSAMKILNVSGIFSTHHQEFSTIHLALVSLMQVFDDRFQAE
jgi:hypothetical protein